MNIHDIRNDKSLHKSNDSERSSVKQFIFFLLLLSTTYGEPCDKFSNIFAGSNKCYSHK